MILIIFHLSQEDYERRGLQKPGNSTCSCSDSTGFLMLSNYPRPCNLLSLFDDQVHKIELIIHPYFILHYQQVSLIFPTFVSLFFHSSTILISLPPLYIILKYMLFYVYLHTHVSLKINTVLLSEYVHLISLKGILL